MKYEKAMLSIINLGNEDILTCSGEGEHHDTAQCFSIMSFWQNLLGWMKPQTPQWPQKPTYTGGGHGGWGGWWRP